MANRGTHEGDNQEIDFVKFFNKNKYDKSFEILTKDKEIDKLYMVRITTNQLSTLSNSVTKTRADSYLIYCEDSSIHSVLANNNYYLDEQIIENFTCLKIPKSGVSIKLKDSHKFQILKVGPSSFYNLFGNYELGAGASLFCQKDNELIKNKNLLKGWKTNIDKMSKFFANISDCNLMFTNKGVCQEIKTYSNNKITELINNSKELQQIVFNGYPIYDEPYSAWYIYTNDIIKPLDYMPFTVTTGSGRSHGDYTIVLKPKKED